MKYLIIDLECTCWDKTDADRDEHETIEIGAVLLDEKFKKMKQKDIFVQPHFNKELSQYCIDLTGITQERLDKEAIPFKDAIELLKGLIDEDTLFCSWGDFDKNQLLRECDAWRLSYPFSSDHLNIKREFAEKLNRKRCGLQKACRLMNLRFNGSPHSGIDDANMIAEVFRMLQKVKKGSKE